MTAYNKKVFTIFNRFLGKGFGPVVADRAISMRKNFDEAEIVEEQYKYVKGGGDYIGLSWERDLLRDPIQKNLIMKSEWCQAKEAKV